MGIVYALVIGLAAGWLAGQLSKGRSFGLVGNLIIGAIGSVLGGVLFSALGLRSASLLGQLVTATVGAIVLLALLNIAMRKK
jgi:uncharacterized membrane protein YeaQ/YmgE (transglycosylase-associated protein family)